MSWACMAVSQHAGCHVAALTRVSLRAPRPYVPCSGRIVALAAMSWALAARQPGLIVAWACRIAGTVQRAGWPCPGLAVLYCNTAQPFLLKPITIQFFFFFIVIQAFSAFKPTSVTIQILYRDTALFPNQASQLQYNVLYCNIVLQQPQVLMSQYGILSHDTISCPQPSLPACNTILVLQYNPCLSSPFKTTILQYNLAFLLQYTWDCCTPRLQYNQCIAI